MNACFISYRHSLSEDAQKVVDEFEKALKGQVNMYWPSASVYRDTTRLAGGDFFTPELAKQLCWSSCMILLYNPGYFDLEHPYCAREYRAMLQLEEQRLDQVPALRNENKSLIIPVVIRGEDDMPNELKQERLYFSLEKTMLYARDLRTRRCLPTIKEIAKAIHQRYKRLRSVVNDMVDQCDSFQFPNEDEINDWLEDLVNALPSQSMPGS